MSKIQTLPCEVKQVQNLQQQTSLDCDGLVFVSYDFQESKSGLPQFLTTPIQEASAIDAAIHEEGAVLAINSPCRRMVYAPTGKLNKDFDDVRSFSETAGKGIRRALKAGILKPLLILPPPSDYTYSGEATLLGALEALYVPLQVREDKPANARKVQTLLVWGTHASQVSEIIKFCVAVEEGRFVARDIGGADPERMTPMRVANYVDDLFANSKVTVHVIQDLSSLEERYPLLAAVNRAASVIERHRGNVVWLEYVGEGNPDATLMLVGKGVTYDTGGADIKAGGVMVGMSRDKCGAAAVAGFFQVLQKLKPKGIVVLGALGLVRNSVGENSYVADEVITSRTGARVRVGNTDAEGRMVMADLLCEMKERAAKFTNPHLMTIATLTGHAVRAVGCGYSIVMDNSVAHQAQHAQKLQQSSELIGDPFEISTIRREDLSFHKGKGVGDDILQSNNLPSSSTQRGHQGPAAFLLLASGLDQHGLASDQPLKYSHLDIAGSAGDLPNEPTGAPILALAHHYLKGRF